MSIWDTSKKQSIWSSSTSKRSIWGKRTAQKTDTLEDLLKIAQEGGLGKEAQKIATKEPKLSSLQRIFAGTTALESGTAMSQSIQQAKEGKLKPSEELLSTFLPLYGAITGKGFTGKYSRSVAKKVAAATTGKEKYLEKEKRYSDVLGELGVKNKYAKAIGGFVGDVALDPITYVGPLGIVKAGAKVGWGALTKVPGIGPRAKTLQKALGRAFVPGYEIDPKIVEGVKKITGAAESPELYTKSGMSKMLKGLEKSWAKIGKSFTEKDLKLFSQLGDKFKKAGVRIKDVDDWRKIPDIERELAKFSPAARDALMGAKGKLGILDRSYKIAKEAGIPEKERFTLYAPGERAGAKAVLPTLGEETVGAPKKFKGKVPLEERISPLEGLMKTEQQVAKNKMYQNYLTRVTKNIADPDTQKRTAEYITQEFGDDFMKNYDTISNITKAVGYDWFSSMWKGYVTSPFPAFHVRNYMSGVLQNYERIGVRAFSPTKIFGYNNLARKLLKGELPTGPITVKGEVAAAKKWIEPFQQYFGKESTRYGAAELGKLEKGSSVLKKLNPASRQFFILQWGRKLGGTIETRQKLAAYFGALEQGNPIKKALKIAAYS